MTGPRRWLERVLNAITVWKVWMYQHKQYVAAGTVVLVVLLSQLTGCSKPLRCSGPLATVRPGAQEVSEHQVPAAVSNALPWQTGTVLLLQWTRGSHLSSRDTYTPGLPPRALKRGLLQTGELARLRLFVNKLIKGVWGTVEAGAHC
jgi:hypothetical protein